MSRGLVTDLVSWLLAGRDVRSEVRLGTKITVAGTLAWWASSELGAHKPVFAVLVPLVAMTGDPFSAVSVSIDRMLGILAGVGIGIGITHVHTHETLLAAAALAAGTLVGILIRVGERVNVQPAVSAIFMISVAGSTGAGIARVWETVVGAAITLVVATLLWPPDPLRELNLRLGRLRQQLAVDLAAVAGALATGEELQLDDVRAHSLDAIRDVFEVAPARRALRLSPLRRHDVERLPDVERRINFAARLYRHARAVARDVADAQLRHPHLAAATRHLADAADRALGGEDAGPALTRAERELASATEGEAAIVAAQLRQLLSDLDARAGSL
jgi:uncharacterized membrane protein YgaE (UPF0421/DUF939 family)